MLLGLESGLKAPDVGKSLAHHPPLRAVATTPSSGAFQQFVYFGSNGKQFNVPTLPNSDVLGVDGGLVAVGMVPSDSIFW